MTSKLLIEACKKGDLETISSLDVKNQYDWHLALTAALRHDYLEVVTWIAENRVLDIKKNSQLNPNTLLSWAAGVGLLDIVKLAIVKGATEYNYPLCLACDDGHVDIVDHLLERGANPDEGLYGACTAQNQEMMIYMVGKGAKKCNNCGRSMEQHLKSTVKIGSEDKKEDKKEDKSENKEK